MVVRQIKIREVGLSCAFLDSRAATRGSPMRSHFLQIFLEKNLTNSDCLIILVTNPRGVFNLHQSVILLGGRFVYGFIGQKEWGAGLFGILKVDLCAF